MKRSLLALGMFALVAVTVAADPPKKLGPEWTYDKKEQHYFKTMQIKAVRHDVDSNSTGYNLNLDHDKVWVTDTDKNFVTRVTLNDKFNLVLRKDPKGKPSSVSVQIDKWVYYDLNCDGEWDARITEQPKRLDRSILLNDQWIRVKYLRGSFGEGLSGELDFIDQKTAYKWDGKVWNAKPSK